jgi:5-formyltetrahydrofolate cyclo-ligase
MSGRHLGSSALKRAKRDVRHAVLARRDALTPEERECAVAEIHARFLDLPEVTGARTAALYWSFGSEVPTPPLLEALHARGVTVVLPRIVAGDLELRTWAQGEPLTETSFGAREPAGGTVVDPSAVDVVATPAVAFDRQGRRVGYGGGFYDRLFPKTDASRIGIAFAVQLVDGALPAGHFDRRVDALVTERGVLRWPRR